VVKVGDIVEYIGFSHAFLCANQRGQVIETHDDLRGYVRIRTFWDGREAGIGSVPAEYLRVVQCPETQALAARADAYQAAAQARAESFTKVYREREQEAFAETARLCGCSPDLVKQVVQTFNRTFKDPTP
jgi:hypothetical protein